MLFFYFDKICLSYNSCAKSVLTVMEMWTNSIISTCNT